MITARAYYEDFRREVGSPSTQNLLTTSAYAAPDLSPSATVAANGVANSNFDRPFICFNARSATRATRLDRTRPPSLTEPLCMTRDPLSRYICTACASSLITNIPSLACLPWLSAEFPRSLTGIPLPRAHSQGIFDETPRSFTGIPYLAPTAKAS
jgi:hypothetical protein